MSKRNEALKLAQDWYDSGNENHDDFANMIKQVIALAEQPAQQQEPVRTRAEFEMWAASYSTFSLEHDDDPARGITGYKSIEQTMLWHAWQAAKTKAPEGASGGESGRETQLDLAETDCTHKFQIAPSSGIKICVNCGLSEMVAQKKAQATSPQRKPWVGLTDEEIDKTYETQVWDARRSYARAIEAKLKEKNA